MSVTRAQELELQEIDRQLAELKEQRDKLNQKINDERMEELRNRYCVKVVCDHCEGSGEIAPHDILDGPDMCSACGGRGWLWAVRWEARAVTDQGIMDLNEVTSAN